MGDTPVGKLNVERNNLAQSLSCVGLRSSDAATHVSNDLKDEVVMQWQAPSKPGRVIFRAVVVKSFEIFWDNIRSPELVVL
nr:hypothetical protein [Physocyclus mexicanus]